MSNAGVHEGVTPTARRGGGEAAELSGDSGRKEGQAGLSVVAARLRLLHGSDHDDRCITPWTLVSSLVDDHDEPRRSELVALASGD